VGEDTDIVSKEMYTFEDRGRAESDKGQSLTLRPENTAGVVRAGYLRERARLGGVGLVTAGANYSGVGQRGLYGSGIIGVPSLRAVANLTVQSGMPA